MDIAALALVDPFVGQHEESLAIRLARTALARECEPRGLGLIAQYGGLMRLGIDPATP